ncbi:M23 family metallopeptidase [Alteromonas sp. 14N.309.X.WAT.G.H12]|uniref:M23 family metallopeptidase n=1 Tax=Alteromonas sp. 14N.309.X.WAT.G.H12 TaxID=3120824 RepID=UPI002FD431F6
MRLGYVTVLLLSLLLSLSTVARGQTDDSPLVLNGKFTQGSLFRGQLPAGSQVWLDGQELNINGQGKFVFGFARQASLSHVVSWTLPDGTTGKRRISLSARDYDIQRIDGLDSAMVTPPESTLARIRNDSVRVAKARAEISDFDGVFTGFIWPAEGPITGVYGSQRILNGKPKTPHYGVDVGAPTGTPVIAPAAGKVTLAEDLYYSGNTVIVDHGMGVFSTFLHLSAMAVKPGPHLDWRINLVKTRLDPALLVPER